MGQTLAPTRTKRKSDKAKRLADAATPLQVERAELQAQFSRQRLTWRTLSPVVVGWMAIMHIGCAFAPFYFSWSAVAVALVLHWLTASIGICLAYHRYLSHRSFKLRPPARFFALLCGAVSAEGSPWVWSATHRLHHQQSDQDGDPHSPLHGGMWSHILWTFLDRAERYDDALLKLYAPDMANDRMIVFLHRTYGLWSIGLGVALYAAGGLPWLFWGLCVRMVACYHSTWFVNSATHVWGYRNYETRDQSRNLWWVAILAYGEGWHNNHHAHPALARAGHRWWEVDITWWSIRALQFVGQAYDVKDHNPATSKTPMPVAG